MFQITSAPNSNMKAKPEVDFCCPQLEINSGAKCVNDKRPMLL